MEMLAPMENLPTTPTPLKSEDKLWIIVSHLSILVGVGLLLPLIVFLVKKDESPFVAAHAKEALNFHISFLVYGIISVFLCAILIGFVLLPILGILVIVFAIMAAIKGSEGGFYKYPMTFRLVS
ncbi:DUF4870 domain-containing protein [soil metagenome]